MMDAEVKGSYLSQFWLSYCVLFTVCVLRSVSDAAHQISLYSHTMTIKAFYKEEVIVAGSDEAGLELVCRCLPTGRSTINRKTDT